MSKEAFQIKEFQDKGFSKEQILDVLDSLGLADNASKRRLVRIVEEVYGER